VTTVVLLQPACERIVSDYVPVVPDTPELCRKCCLCTSAEPRVCPERMRKRPLRLLGDLKLLSKKLSGLSAAIAARVLARAAPVVTGLELHGRNVRQFEGVETPFLLDLARGIARGRDTHFLLARRDKPVG